MTYASRWSRMHPREFVSSLGSHLSPLLTCCRFGLAASTSCQIEHGNTRMNDWERLPLSCRVTSPVPAISIAHFHRFCAFCEAGQVNGDIVWSSRDIFKPSSKRAVLHSVSVAEDNMKGLEEWENLQRGNGVKCKRPMALLSWLLFNKTDLFYRSLSSFWHITPTLDRSRFGFATGEWLLLNISNLIIFWAISTYFIYWHENDSLAGNVDFVLGFRFMPPHCSHLQNLLHAVDNTRHVPSSVVVLNA